MNSRKGERPKIYPEVTPLPTEVPVGESKLWFVRSNVNDFYAFIWLKLRIISYPECFKLFCRLGGASGAKIELQLWSDIIWFTIKSPFWRRKYFHAKRLPGLPRRWPAHVDLFLTFAFALSFLHTRSMALYSQSFFTGRRGFPWCHQFEKAELILLLMKEETWRSEVE